MLNKLLKHELKATSRLLLPLYLILMLVSLLDRFVLSLDIFTGALAIIPGLFTAVYVISIIAVLVTTFLLMITRFYKNLMSDEGYLMFTLPVSSERLIISKLVVSILWTFASVIAVVASLAVVFATPDNMQVFWRNFDTILAELRTVFKGRSALLIVEFIVMILFGVIQYILLIYVSIAVGHLFTHHKLAGSIIAYFCIYTAAEILIVIVLAVGGMIFRKSFAEMNSIPAIVFPASIVITSVFNLLYFFATNYIFKKHLNLE